VTVDIEAFKVLGADRLPGLIGIEIDEIEPGRVRMHLALRDELLAPNGYLHAATVVALADSACGYGCIASLPDKAIGFTTIELKTNFIRSARTGDALRAEARLAHGGRTTQVWDAGVTRESDGKDLALFRCTQYLLAVKR
jgi:1,4-dihydroxy-2-naphthoyl-CoA hydrolase